MIRPVPTIDPRAHRAAIDALEAQRAAYHRYARAMAAQQQVLGDGDGDRAMAAADAAARGFDELQTGARRLQPLVERAHEAGTPEQLTELQRHLDALMREARLAEAAIQNMTGQLEAWRDAYGRQLAELGVTPGATPNATPNGTTNATTGVAPGAGIDEAAAAGGYGPRGVGASRATSAVPSLIDRRG